MALISAMGAPQCTRARYVAIKSSREISSSMGFSTIEEIAYVPASELNGIEEFDEEIVKELRTRARDVLLTQAIASEESASGSEPAADLIEIVGDPLASTLAAKAVRTREDLADLSVDELIEVGGTDEKQAAELIMEARKHWFAEEAKA